MNSRVGTLHSPGHDRDRGTLDRERAPVRRTVDADGCSGNDRPPAMRNAGRQVGSELLAVPRGGSRPDDRDRALGGPGEVERTTHPEAPGRHGEIIEPRWPLVVAGDQEPRAHLRGHAQVPGRVQLLDPWRIPLELALTTSDELERLDGADALHQRVDELVTRL